MVEPRYLRTVKWNDFLQILRVRAVEEADARDEMWDAATLRRITLAARNPIDRASQLIAKSRMPALAESLRVPVVPGWIVAFSSAIAFIAGWCFAALGQEREINLLALPLIALLLWNAAVLLFSLFHGLKKPDRARTPSWLEKLLDRFSTDAAPGMTDIRARFRTLAWPPMLRRANFRFRAWLHLGAALLAFGSITGMYARGWSKEYRAVWESTLLNENSAQTFFRVLFTPASKVTGVKIPLDEIRQMHRGAEAYREKTGAALPWIHLYATTLALFIILPRVLFALLESSRANRVPALELRSAEWRDYLAAIHASAQGDGATVEIVTHALSLDDASHERWRQLARTRWRDADSVNCHTIAPGVESDFVSAWKPVAPRVLLVFNLAATPETEVHRALAESVMTKLNSTNPSMVLALTLDDTELKRRWSTFADAATKIETRTASWHEVMRGLAVEWI
ncbi:MAG: DUF2868 domain-containing protein [Verrucomicrobia bacterium]|nr:DUF2868 domain-containing protein [Verrucomicrobiota bacterium]